MWRQQPSMFFMIGMGKCALHIYVRTYVHTVKLAYYVPQSGHRISTYYQKYVRTIRVGLCT